jgi:ferritin-like metal-binding protein YciE
MAKRKTTTRRAKETPDAQEMLVLELQEIHSAESQLARVLPRLVKAAESETFRSSLEERLAQGERLITEVEAALEELDATPGRKKNVAAEGLINDAREHVQEIAKGPALDAVLLAGIQKTEHYCIAAWGTVKAIGAALGEKEVVKSMDRALKEGYKLDEGLTKLAETELMPAVLALAEGGEEFDDDEEELSSNGGRGNQRSRGEGRVST